MMRMVLSLGNGMITGTNIPIWCCLLYIQPLLGIVKKTNDFFLCLHCLVLWKLLLHGVERPRN